MPPTILGREPVPQDGQQIDFHDPLTWVCVFAVVLVAGFILYNLFGGGGDSE